MSGRKRARDEERQPGVCFMWSVNAVKAFKDTLNDNAEKRAYREAEISMMDDLSEGDFQKEEEEEEEPASPPAPSAPSALPLPPPPPPLPPLLPPPPQSPTPPPQQHTDPASPTVAMTPEPVARGGEQATPSEVEYQ
ncbi:unnamed protein product [Arctogadus glacialis]